MLKAPERRKRYDETGLAQTEGADAVAISELIVQASIAVLQQPRFDPRSHDMIGAMRAHLGHAQQQHAEQLAQFEPMRARITAILDRLDAPDNHPIRIHYRMILAGMDGKEQNARNAIRLIEQALGELAKLRYRFDALEEWRDLYGFHVASSSSVS